jgi:hypothetical protein
MCVDVCVRLCVCVSGCMWVCEGRVWVYVSGCGCMWRRPLPVDRFERHSHRRCPRPPALQLPSLSSDRALEGEIQAKNKKSH